MPRVQEINDIRQLDQVRQTWSSLLARTPGATFFQTLDWLEVYWRHFGAGQRLRLLVVHDRDEWPIGILPLVVRWDRTRLGPVRTLTYPLDDWGSFYGPIGPDPEAVLRAGLAHVRATPRDWQVLSLRWVDTAGSDAGVPPAAAEGAGGKMYPRVRAQTSLIELQGGWESYLAERGSKWRNNLRRWQRKLQEQGELTFHRYRPRGAALGESDPRWDLFDTCVDLARRSWQGTSRTGTTLSHATVAGFLRDLHARAAAVGGLDLNLLRLDGKPLAFAYNYFHHGHVYGLRIGYDASLSQNGVGNMMYTSVIEDSFRRGDHTYDLGAGSLDCKRHFRTEVRDIWQYDHFSFTPRAQILRLRRVADSSNKASRPFLAAADKDA